MMKESEVVSSQASTADSSEVLQEDGINLYISLDAANQHFTAMQSSQSYGPQVLRLEHMLAMAGEHATSSGFREVASSDEPPQLGSGDLPSVGSLGHYLQRCKPCAFVNKIGCANGTQCSFCHLCSPGEKKRRRKEKRCLLHATRKLALHA